MVDRAAHLIVIGIDGLTWRDARRSLQAGIMPQLRALGNGAVLAPVVGADDESGLAAWTTLATGLFAEDHGVCFADEAGPAGQLRPTTRRSWTARPWWEGVDAAGLPIASVAWPANAPGAHLPGDQIDDSIAFATGPDRDRWALPLQCAAAATRSALRDRRIHPTDIAVDLVARFVTDLGLIDQSRDPWLPHIAVALARAATVQAASVRALEEGTASVVVLHQRWLADMRAAFDPAPSPVFAPAMPMAFAFLDDMIGRLATSAGPNATVLLMSPDLDGEAGFLLATGPGAGQATGNPIRVQDIVPTLLGHLGLADPDLPGKVQPFLTQRSDPRLVPPSLGPSPVTAVKPLDPRLTRLGYHHPQPVPSAWYAHRSALVALLILPRAPETALIRAQAAWAIDPDNLPALYAIALAAFALRKPAALEGVAEAFDRLAPQRIWGDLVRGAHALLQGDPAGAAAILPRNLSDTDPRALAHLADLWMLAQRPIEAKRLYARLRDADPRNRQADLGLARCAIELRDYHQAETRLRALREESPFTPQIYEMLALLYAVTGRTNEARQMDRIRQSLE